MPNWRKLIVSGSDASLNSLNVTTNVTAQSFTGSFSGSFTAPGATTQIVYNSGGTLAADSGLVYSGSRVGIGTSSPSAKLEVVAGEGSAGFNKGINIVSGNGTYTTGHGGILQFQNEDVITAGIRGVRDPGSWASSLLFYTHTSGTGNTFGTTFTEKMRITDGGNVGIGTSSPGYILDVQAASAIIQLKSTTGTNPALYKAANGSNSSFFGPEGSSAGNVFVGSLAYATLLGNFDAQALQFGTNAAIRTTITSGGNVGIGTTSPSARLSLGAASHGQRITWEDYSNVTSEYSSGDLWLSSNFYPNSGSSGYKTSVTAAYGAAGISVSGTGGGLNGVLKFFVDDAASKTAGASFTPTERMRVAGDGNIGIGTTSPGAARLNVVSGNNSNNPIIEAYALNLSQGIGLAYNGLQAIGSNGDVDIIITPKGTGKSCFSTGNVGIGTTSPTDKLHVNGDTRIVGNTYVGGIINAYQGDASIWVPNLGQAFTVKQTTGNIGIGTNTPGELLEVVGNIRANVSNGGGFMLTGASASGLVRAGATGLALRTNTTDRLTVDNSGNVGIGTTSPSQKLSVVGAVSASTYYGDGSNLTNIGSGSISAAGSDGQLQYNNSGLFGGASRLYYNDTTNRVGIGTSSPGYDLDVSGSVRVQDRLRVGTINTGNGVIHQSSDATINASGATIVWSVPGSSGAVAFIEYYIINTVTNTSQRGGNIVVTWNSAGTPQITHTETTTPDIGTTALITFTTAITLGGDPQLIATNTSINPFYIVLNYRYF